MDRGGTSREHCRRADKGVQRTYKHDVRELPRAYEYILSTYRERQRHNHYSLFDEEGVRAIG